MEDDLREYLANIFEDTNENIFQKDNAPGHKEGVTRQSFEDNDIWVIQWCVHFLA